MTSSIILDDLIKPVINHLEKLRVKMADFYLHPQG